ncbi:MAG: CHAT domain-containing protein, partial [Blastocatellia bacterium]|nr:CHAT domain-containing protein [Blastocatellia bacterium]
CDTGRGKEINGEGLLGLTHGLLSAGAKRVMASLWRVNDASTAHLMKVFYERLLREPKLSPTAALRAAQIEMIQTKVWQMPYYWAAFTIQGDW